MARENSVTWGIAASRTEMQPVIMLLQIKNVGAVVFCSIFIGQLLYFMYAYLTLQI